MNSSEPNPTPSPTEEKSFPNAPHSVSDLESLHTARRFNYTKPYGRGGTRTWRKRMMIYNRDEGICQICQELVDLKYPKYHPRSLTMDHKRPRSKGGTSHTGNLQTAHFECNKRKGDQFTTEEELLPEDELYLVTREWDNTSAGMIVRRGKIIATAPKLKWAKRHKLKGTIPYLEKHGYRVDRWKGGSNRHEWWGSQIAQISGKRKI